MVQGFFLPAALAADEGVHLASDRTTSLMWTVSDGLNFRWDINSNGAVADGTNDAYDSGMQLQLNSESFPGYSTAKLDKDGREIELGPWQHRGLNVYRRIYIPPKGGYCRWIDIFENPSASEVPLAVRYYSNMGDSTSRTFTTSGEAEVAEKDWGIVTSGASDTSRPSVVHVFATSEAKVKPRFQFNRGNDDIYCNFTLKVPAGKTLALCMFEAQRSPYEAATKFLKEFQPMKELSGVSPALRRMILNLGGGGSMLGDVELRRSDEADLVVLRTGDEILGRIVNQQYTLAASFGEVKLAAADVVAVIGLSPDNNRVQVVLVGGQVVAGELSGELTVKLASGSDLRIPPKGMVQAAYKIAPDKPSEIAVSGSLVVLRSGEQLGIDDSALALDFQTTCGNLSLSSKDLLAIEMDTPGGGLHRAVFRNGSVLAGLLTAEKLPLKLKLRLPLDIPSAQVRKFQFANVALDDKTLTRLTLKNTDVLAGSFVEPKWTVASKFGSVSVATGDIAEAEFLPESLGQVKVTLRDGTKLGGQLGQEYVSFKLEPGPAVKVFVGHLASATGGAARPTTAPAPVGAGPTTTTTAPAAAAPTAAPLPAEKAERLAYLKIEIATSEAALAICTADLDKTRAQAQQLGDLGKLEEAAKVGVVARELRKKTDAIKAQSQRLSAELDALMRVP